MHINDLTDMLFLRLHAIYGNKWTDQYPNPSLLDLARKEWAEALDGLNEEDISRAMRECRDTLDWPPSIAAFKKAAIGEQRQPAHRIVDPRQLLGSGPEGDRRDAVIVELSEMRRKLR